jgi:uncharacterized membrane protein YfcA
LSPFQKENARNFATNFNMEIAGYIASVLIGISLGLIGGGGSILTVPVMVYLFGITPSLATSYSLFIVGATSLVGAVNNHGRGLVHTRTAFLFAISSIITVFITRKLIIPAIPRKIVAIDGFVITEPLLTMVLFALLMLVAGASMIKENITEPSPATTGKNNLPRLILYGVLIGLVTGLLGAGGGFLLIPTLVLFLKLPMKEAVGTSLLIIALNSLIGFTGDIGHFAINWPFLLTITGIAIGGIILGGVLARKVPGEKLKKGFGWFVLAMGLCILAGELIFTR